MTRYRVTREGMFVLAVWVVAALFCAVTDALVIRALLHPLPLRVWEIRCDAPPSRTNHCH